MGIELTEWRIEDHLKTPEEMLGYLEAAFEEGDPEFIAMAVQDVARAKGIPVPAALTGDTAFGDFLHTLKALGFELTAKAA